MDKEKLNRLRRMAGAPVDYSANPRKVTSLVEDGIPGISQIFRGGDKKFYLVCDADDKAELGDVLTELDFPALVNILKTAKSTKDWELFPHSEKNKALDLARKRLATVTESDGFGPGAMSSNPDSTPYPSDEDIDKAVRGDDDVDDDYYSDDLDDSDDFEPDTNICPDCEGGIHPPSFGVCERCGGEGEIFESKEEKEDDKDDDDDKDDKKSDKKSDKKDKKDDNDDDESEDKDEDDKDDDDKDDDEEEVKENLQNVLDVKPQKAADDYEMTNDTRPVKVPAKVLSELKRVIKEVTAEAEKAKPRDHARSHYYEDTAEAMQIVLDFLNEKTVQGLKQAQIYSQRMANVSRALFPDVVWKFIVNGGETRSLSSYYKEVKVKDPVTGKPFGNVGITQLNKNTRTE